MWCTSAPSVTARKELVNVVLTLEWYCVPVYQVSMSGTLTQPSYNYIGINKFYCLRLFVVVYKLVIRVC